MKRFFVLMLLMSLMTAAGSLLADGMVSKIEIDEEALAGEAVQAEAAPAPAVAPAPAPAPPTPAPAEKTPAAAPSPAPATDDSVKIHLKLKDGASLPAKLINSEDIKVNTTFGVLTIPWKSIYHIEFGTRPDPEIEKKVKALIDQLSNEDWNIRNNAVQQIIAVGGSALPYLDEAKKAKDPEKVNRATEAITKIKEKNGNKTVLTEDVIGTTSFTVKGAVQLQEMKLETNLGVLSVKCALIDTVRTVTSGSSEKKLSLTGEFVAQIKMMDTGIEVVANSPLLIAVHGSISSPQEGRDNIPPEGIRNNPRARFGQGTVVGRIGENGELFLIGSKYVNQNPAGGKLYVGINASGWIVNQAQEGNIVFDGNFDVSIKTGAQAAE